MTFASLLIIVLFCVWIGIVIGGFVVNRLIGPEGRVRAEELRRERQAQWEREHLR